MAPKIKTVEFRDFQPEDRAELRQMIFQLYQEDPEGEPITGDKIDNTVRELSDHPEKGWGRPDYDDAGWRSAGVLGKFGAPPWKRFSPAPNLLPGSHRPPSG